MRTSFEVRLAGGESSWGVLAACILIPGSWGVLAACILVPPCTCPTLEGEEKKRKTRSSVPRFVTPFGPRFLLFPFSNTHTSTGILTRRRQARLPSTGSSIATIAVSWISCRPSPVINTTIASTSGRIHCCHMHEYVHVCIASAATSPAFNTSATSEFVGLLRPDPAESGAYGGASGTCTHTKKCSGTLRACI